MNTPPKALVWQYWQTMNIDQPEAACDFLSKKIDWNGFEPLRKLGTAEAVVESYWRPLMTAMPDLTRRTYHFLGSSFEGGDWVAGTGDFIGTFANDLVLDGYKIPANGQSVHVRFGEFCKVEADKIVEIRIIIDLPDLCRQAGISLLPLHFGRDIWIPGPLAGNAVLLTDQDPAESAKSLGLVEAMIFGGLNSYDGKDQASQGLERYWHADMVWHGPVGIGSSYGMDEFKRNAQGPIVHAFPDRRGVGHKARIAEGHLIASTGWPSLGGTHLNDFMDWKATGEYIGWNIMDFWTRDGNKLRENWVLIDLIGAAKESKVDLLAKLPRE